MVDLFGEGSEGQTAETPVSRPLADRMRPQRLEEFVGQSQLLGEDTLLRRLIAEDRLPSMLFWGPPGCGKTALAAVIANTAKSAFVTLSAVTAVAQAKGPVRQFSALSPELGSTPQKE